MVKFFFIVILFYLFTVNSFSMIKVFGKVTGTDGKPMTLANVLVTYPSDNKPIKSVKVQKDGNYVVDIDSEGIWILHFIGIYHHEYSIAIYSNKPNSINLDVKLETYNYAKSLDGVKVIGNFNNWSVQRAVAMHKDKDGTYSVIVKNNSDTLFYRLVYARTDGEIAGTDADGFIPNGLEGYTSYIINGKGDVKIKFDPGKLLYSDDHESFKFGQPNSFQAKFAKAYATLVNAEHDFKISLYTHTANRQIVGYRFDFTPYILKVRKMLKSVKKGLIQQVLQLSYFSLNYMKSSSHYVDVSTSRKTLKVIPMNSIIWSLNPHAILQALTLGAFTEPQRDKYIHEVLDTNPMARTKEILLLDTIDRKFHSLNYSEILPYLSILLDQYGNSPEALTSGKEYAKTYILLKDGTPAPLFSVELSTDTSQHFTNNSFKGKFYLLYFWSASNKTCLNEIKNIIKVYKKFKDKNFEVLSVSIDSTSQNIYKINPTLPILPWYNIVKLKDYNNKICKDFEVYSVPKAILVDPNGNLVSSGWGLRGNNLEKTLEKYIGK